MGKKMSGAQKRKKKKEKEAVVKEAVADMERLKLGPTKLWTGLVTHHKDVFVSHVIPKLNETDQFFFGMVNRESRGVLEYAGVNIWGLTSNVYECTSISTLEWMWSDDPWRKKYAEGNVKDRAWFCAGVALTNKLEFLKWAREEKHCEWDEETIKAAARRGNLEMLKYCFSNGCPYDEEGSCELAAGRGSPRLSSISFRQSETFARDGRGYAAGQAACGGHVEILKYFVEERKISDGGKGRLCVPNAARYGQLDCLKYLVEEAKAPLDSWDVIAYARYHEHSECENYLLEKGCPEPTDEDYARFAKSQRE